MKFLTLDNTPLSQPTTAPDQDAEGLPDTVREFVSEAIADNTRRAYRSDLDHFTAWGGSIPCTPEVVASYLAGHAHIYAVATLQRRIASINTAHTASGHPSPTASKLVQATMRGIRKKQGSQQRQAQPLMLEDLIRIMPMLTSSPRDSRDRALLLIGFAGGFRRSELVGLNVEDIEPARQGLIIDIRRSKTDQMGEGRKVGIPFARGQFCPVQALEHWVEFSRIESGPLFRSVNRHGAISEKCLSGEAVSIIIKERVSLIGLDPAAYSGHSLRAGLATSAAMAGISSMSIRQQTGHKSDTMLARYVRSGELFSNNAAGQLL